MLESVVGNVAHTFVSMEWYSEQRTWQRTADNWEIILNWKSFVYLSFDWKMSYRFRCVSFRHTMFLWDSYRRLNWQTLAYSCCEPNIFLFLYSFFFLQLYPLRQLIIIVVNMISHRGDYWHLAKGEHEWRTQFTTFNTFLVHFRLIQTETAMSEKFFFRSMQRTSELSISTHFVVIISLLLLFFCFASIKWQILCQVEDSIVYIV